MANQQRVVVTGASRGIGLEFVRQLARRGDRVFATARDPDRAKELKQLAASNPGLVTVVQLDVDDAKSIRAAEGAIDDQTDAIDLLVNNAGIYAANVTPAGAPAEKLGAFNFDDALAVLRTNAVSPLLVAQAFLPLLKRSKSPRVVNISSGYGSVGGNTGGFPYYYGASKAALNMFMRSFAADANTKPITTIVMSPGWVRTDMGTSAAPLSPEESVSGMLKVIDGLKPADNSRFLDHAGDEVAW